MGVIVERGFLGGGEGVGEVVMEGELRIFFDSVFV